MASVRIALLTQARALGPICDDHAARAAAVEQLVRRARLTPDAATTLDWALASLGAHPEDSSDELACRLLRAARAQLAGPAGDRPGAAAAPPSLAWV